MGNKRGVFRDLLNHPRLFNAIRHLLDGGQLPHLKAVLERHGVKSVLDVGCGTGDYCPAAAGPYLGIDMNPHYIEYAARKYGGRQKSFQTMDVRNIGGINRRFDAAILVNTIHHLPDDLSVDILKCLGQVASLVVIHDIIPVNPYLVFRALQWLDRGEYIRTLEQQAGLMERASLKIKDMVTFWSGSHLYHHSIIVSGSFRETFGSLE